MPERRRDTLPKNRRTTSAAGPAARARRISRKEREAKQRRILYSVVGAAGTLAIVILLIFSANQYWFRPRQVLASINGTDIRRSDYWKVRSFDLINQVNTYSSYAQDTSLTSDEQSQYASFAQSAADDLNKTWNSTSLDASTLATMVEDQVYVQNASKLGITVTEQEIDDYITQIFQPSDAPLITPTPTATLIPARAAWATETAIAAAGGTPVANAASPVASNGTPVAGAATPSTNGTPIVASGGTPTVASPAATSGGSPVSGTPAASPASETPTIAAATPNPVDAMATVTASYKSFKSVTLKTAHMSVSDFRRLIVTPAIVREKVTAMIDAQVGQSGPQVHAAQILVDTKDLSDSISKQLQQPGANFEQIAKDQSEDSTTAPNGGDLGWVAKNEVDPAIEKVLFSTAAGQISAPFQTVYGWSIIKVYATDPNRPMTTDQLTKVQTTALQNWVTEQEASMKISSKAKPTPTPATQTFAPPANAPPTPTATAEPASPVAETGSPVAATPVASPITQAGTPAVVPGASPAAASSPKAIATPSGSPAASPSSATPSAVSSPSGPATASPNP